MKEGSGFRVRVYIGFRAMFWREFSVAALEGFEGLPVLELMTACGLKNELNPEPSTPSTRFRVSG